MLTYPDLNPASGVLASSKKRSTGKENIAFNLLMPTRDVASHYGGIRFRIVPQTRAVYQLRITLQDIQPSVWRQIQVWEDITLGQLHTILQIVMDWEDYHLHEFTIGRRLYSVPDPDDEMHERKVIDESRAKLCDVVPRVGTQFVYAYDFGDDWQHDLVVEKILPPADGVVYPVCKAGKRNCPPEDCGGPYGYYDLLNTFPDSEDPEYLGMIAHDPEAFSLEAVNSDLAPSPPIRSARRAPKR